MEENGVPVRNHPKSKLRMALPQILAVMVKNVLMLSYGTTIGYPAILIPSLTGNDPSETIIASEEDISWISSLNKLIVPISSVLSGILTEPIGRKRTMQCLTIPFVTGWLILRFSRDIWQIYCALAIFGMCGGLIEAPVQTYVAEITQPEYRGMLSVVSSSITVLGVLVEFIIGTFFSWRNSALISCIFPITSFILLIFIPESPYWLLRHDKEKLARENLAWFRGWSTVEEIEPEFQQILLQTEENRNKLKLTALEADDAFLDKVKRRLRRLKRFSDRDFYWPFSIVMTAFLMNHFTGSTTLFNYAVLIFRNLRVPIDEYYATIVVGVASVLGCIVAMLMIKYVGKRKLVFISLIGMIVSTLGVSIYTYLVGIREFIVVGELDNSSENAYGVIPLVFIILLAFTSYSGFKNLPWALLVEIYPEDIRGSACGLSGALGYLLAFASNKLFLEMMSAFTFPGVYLFHGILGLIGLVLFYFILPETEGRSLQEISEHFLGVSKLSKKYSRKIE